MFAYGITSAMTVPLEKDVRTTVDSVWREPRIRVHHESINVTVGPLQKCELMGLVLKIRELSGSV